MRVRALAFLVLAGMVCSGSAMAVPVKAKPKAAPAKAKAAATAPAKDPLISIYGSASQAYSRYEIGDRAEARQPYVIARTGASTTDPADWLPANDRARSLLKKNPRRWAAASVVIAFDETGKTTSCGIEEQAGDPVLLDRICDRLLLPTQFVPPMFRDGKKYLEFFRLKIRFGPEHRTGPLPVVSDGSWWSEYEQAPSYVPHLFDVTGLPPMRFSVDAIPVGARAIGVFVNIKDGKAASCQVRLTSGDDGLDQRACDLAQRAQYRPLDAATDARLPLLFYVDGANFGALVPTTERKLRPMLQADAAKHLLADIRAVGGGPTLDGVEIDGLVGTDGTMIDCWVTKGTGSDKADLALCDHLMSAPYFVPGRDIFGRLMPSRLYGLDLGGKQD